MRNKGLIIGSIILVLLVARLVLKQVNKYSTERKWYVENLNYEFTAVVDSIEFFNNRGGGFLFCRTLDGRPINRTVEDSLQEHLEQFQILRFMFFRKDGRAAKLSWETQQYEIGDSIYVNSKIDVFRITRNRKILRSGKVSNELYEKMF